MSSRLTLVILLFLSAISAFAEPDLASNGDFAERADLGVPASVGGDGQLQLLVEHSLDDGVSFVPRGTLTVHSLRTGGSTSFPQNTLSPQEIASLESLCASKGLYLIRLRQQQLGKGGDVIHRSVTDPCHVLDSGLRDVLTLHLDWRSQLVGVSVSAAQKQQQQQQSPLSSSPSSSPKRAASVVIPDGFRTQVVLQQMEAGPVPDTQSFIQKVEQEKLAKQRGETPDNRGFLAKYWMYIVPVVIILAMNSGGGGQDAGGGR